MVKKESVTVAPRRDNSTTISEEPLQVAGSVK